MNWWLYWEPAGSFSSVGRVWSLIKAAFVLAMCIPCIVCGNLMSMASDVLVLCTRQAGFLAHIKCLHSISYSVSDIIILPSMVDHTVWSMLASGITGMQPVCLAFFQADCITSLYTSYRNHVDCYSWCSLPITPIITVIVIIFTIRQAAGTLVL